MSYKEQQTTHGSFNTPRYLFNYLHKFFRFEVDPCDSGNNWLNLTYSFTAESKEFNGLQQEWFGNTFVNPPYGLDNEIKWIAKVFKQYNNHGHTIFMLLPAKTESKWFSTMMINSDIIIFPRKRISFVKENKVMNGNNIGSVIFGLRAKDEEGVKQTKDFLNYNRDQLDVDYDIIGDDRYILFPDTQILKKLFSHGY